MWLLTLAGVLFVAACASLIPCLGVFIAFAVMALYCGLYRELFRLGVTFGTADEPTALAWSNLVELRGRGLELALNGLVIVLIAGLLSAAGSYAYQAAGVGHRSVEVCANPNAAAAPRAAPETSPAEETKATPRPPRQGCMNAPSLGLAGFALAWLMLAIQGLYWPMALTLSCVSESITDLFRIDRIARAIFAAGAPYLFVVVLGTTGVASLLWIPTLIAAWGSRLGAITLLLLPFPWIAYVGAAVSYLMGRTLAARADQLGSLLE